MNIDVQTESEGEQKSSASSAESDSEYETAESDYTCSDENEEVVSDVWILTYKPGGKIRSSKHLTSIIKDKLPDAKIKRKAFYFGKKLGGVKFVLPDEITYKQLYKIMGEWNDYLCYNIDI